MAAPAQSRRLPEAAVPALADALAAAPAPDRVVAGADERRRHGTDESFHGPALPDLVVYPLDVEEAARVVRVCREHRAPIVPFGAGTSLEGHIAAVRGGVSVDMSRMDAILRLSVDDMDVTVQAGVTRLFVGSEGTLGLVCEATLRIQPTPEAMAAAVCPFATLADAVRCVMDVGRLGVPVAR